MSGLPLTPERLRAIYTCLRAFPPFCRLKLPDSVSLRVTRHKDREGHYTRYLHTDKHVVCVSEVAVDYFGSVVEVMAHEMIHLHQGVAKTETSGEHNAEFLRIAKRACRSFGWDYKKFIR